MPFDGAPKIPASHPTPVLDRLIEFFDGGRRWCQGKENGPGGKRCLTQAMTELRARQRTEADHSYRYILRAIRATTRHRYLIEFNDNCSGYAEVEQVLRHARVLAQADMRG